MKTHEKMQSHRSLAGVLFSAAFLFTAPLCQAGAALVFSLEPVTVGAGTTGDTFDVLLTNNAGSAVSIGGFSFGIDVATSNLTFTGVDISPVTATYIFAGNSLFGPDISVQPPTLPGQTLEAEDIPNVGSASVGVGASVGLGLVKFNVAAGTLPGPVAVTFISAVDSLLNPAGGGIAFSTVNGTVTVSGASTPEPGTAVLAGLALVAIVAGVRRRAVRSI